MMQASLHATTRKLTTHIVHITNTTDVPPFHTLDLTCNDSTLRLFTNLNQLQELANTLNTYLAQHNPNTTTTEQPTNAHPS